MNASECKCSQCEKQAEVFWPAFDPDIPLHPYCRECINKIQLNFLIQHFSTDEETNE